MIAANTASTNIVSTDCRDDTVVDGADLVLNDTFAHQVGKHPVRPMYRYIAHGFPYAVIGKGDNAAVSRLEVLAHGGQGLSLFELGVGQGRQKIVLAGKPAQHDVGQGDSPMGIQVAKCDIVIRTRLQGYAL